MKIVKGTTWLKRDFIEQLEQLLETNHVVEIDQLVDFDGREQFVKNMLIRLEVALATENDIIRQDKVDCEVKKKATKDIRYQNKLKQEEEELEAKINGKI